MSPEFSIPVHDLDAAGKAYRFPIRAEWINRAFLPVEGAPARSADQVTAAGPDGELDVRVSKSGTDVVVRGKLSAELEVPCARCLKPTRVTIAEPLAVLMVPAQGMKTPGDEYEFTADEADVLPYEGDNVVLDDLVRDELLLEIPMIPLCSETCPGISPTPETHAATPAEPHIDPRLAPLLRFKAVTKKS